MPSNPEMDRALAEKREAARRRMVCDLCIKKPWTIACPKCDPFLDSLIAAVHVAARAQWEQERGTPLTDAEIAEVYDSLDAPMPLMANRVSWREHSIRFARAMLARGQSPAPDVRALQREAWDACRDWEQGTRFAMKSPEMYDAERDRRWPIAPPSVTPEPKMCERCGGPMPWFDAQWANHTDVESCVKHLHKQVVALAASHRGRDK